MDSLLYSPLPPEPPFLSPSEPPPALRRDREEGDPPPVPSLGSDGKERGINLNVDGTGGGRKRKGESKKKRESTKERNRWRSGALFLLETTEGAPSFVVPLPYGTSLFRPLFGN